MNIINQTIKLKIKLNQQLNKENKTQNITICKTLNSIIFIKNNKLYFYDNAHSKIIDIVINKQTEVFSNDIFYMIIDNNNITLIDETCIEKVIYIPYNIQDIYIKNEYFIVKSSNNFYIINKFGTIYLKNYEIIELNQLVILNSDNNNYLITNNGLISRNKLCNNKVKVMVELLKYTNGIDNLIKIFDTNSI